MQLRKPAVLKSMWVARLQVELEQVRRLSAFAAVYFLIFLACDCFINICFDTGFLPLSLCSISSRLLFVMGPSSFLCYLL